MSGHSKWATIKHKKGITDAKRGQLFSKLSKNITIAARTGTDPRMNVSLANAIEKAREMNMPNDNIDRAIKRVSDKASAQLSEILIEAIGPGGVAFRIKGITDNSNRTVSEVKKILSDNGAKMVQPGSISWMFASSVAADAETQEQINKLEDALDDNDDIDDVTSNLQEETPTV